MMKTLKFSNGDKMPMLGLGTWKSGKGEVLDAILEAIKIGYRHLDCALRYENEPEVGDAIREAIKSGLVRRDELWVTTKLWNNAHKEEDVEPAIRESLDALQLDYLDLYLVHWPVAFKPEIGFPRKGSDFLNLEQAPLEETWEGMQRCREKGLSRHIGVSNFSITKLERLTNNTGCKPECNQVEMHPFLQQNELVKYAKKANIHLTAYAPLGSKDRADWLKADDEPSLLKNPVILQIAQEKSCSPGQVLIAWALDRGTSVIPKSSNPGRLKENFESTKLVFSDRDRTRIAALDKHYRFIPGTIWTIPGSPYTLENLWDE